MIVHALKNAKAITDPDLVWADREFIWAQKGKIIEEMSLCSSKEQAQRFVAEYVKAYRNGSRSFLLP